MRANASLVTDAQLGGDGVLSPGETSQRFRLEVYFRENQPFTFFVDTSAVILNETGVVCTDPYTVPDVSLDNAIRRQLRNGSGYLSCAAITSLTSLRADSEFITNLEGLQYAPNLTFLELGENKISDLTPLQNLTNLKQLYLYKNDVTDISALVSSSGLGSGDSVSLRNNPLSPQAIKDVETLVARGVKVEFDGGTGDTCTNPVVIPDQALEAAIRERLRLGENSGDLTCTNMRSLSALRVNSGGITSLEGLQNAVNLTFLNFGKNNISDLSPLQNLTNLEQLLLYDNDISDVSA